MTKFYPLGQLMCFGTQCKNVLIDFGVIFCGQGITNAAFRCVMECEGLCEGKCKGEGLRGDTTHKATYPERDYTGTLSHRCKYISFSAL